MSAFDQHQSPQSKSTKSDPARQQQTMQPVGAEVDLPNFFLNHLGQMDEDKAFLLETRVDNLTLLSSLLWSRRDDCTP